MASRCARHIRHSLPQHGPPLQVGLCLIAFCLCQWWQRWSPVYLGDGAVIKQLSRGRVKTKCIQSCYFNPTDDRVLETTYRSGTARWQHIFASSMFKKAQAQRVCATLLQTLLSRLGRFLLKLFRLIHCLKFKLWKSLNQMCKCKPTKNKFWNIAFKHVQNTVSWQ